MIVLPRRGLLSVLPAAALAACASVPRQEYQIVPVPGETDPGVTGRIGIRAIGIPAALDQNEIARPGGTYQVARFAQDVWAAPLGQMLQSVMVQNLLQRLPGADVIASGGAIGAPADVVVEINILAFAPAPSGVVNFMAQIAIRTGGTDYATDTATAAATPSSADAAGIAAAMSGIWGQAADQIVKDMK